MTAEKVLELFDMDAIEKCVYNDEWFPESFDSEVMIIATLSSSQNGIHTPQVVCDSIGFEVPESGKNCGEVDYEYFEFKVESLLAEAALNLTNRLGDSYISFYFGYGECGDYNLFAVKEVQ